MYKDNQVHNIQVLISEVSTYFAPPSQEKFYTLNQGNMSNEDYLEKFNNLVDMAYAFNGQLHNQDIVDIVKEGTYLGGSYEILEPEKKEIL